MAIMLHSNNEQPGWTAVLSTRDIFGVKQYADYSTGYTFTCCVLTTANVVLLTKTTGITGFANGIVTVAFTGAELVTAGVTGTPTNPGAYQLQLTPRRTADNADGPTAEDTLVIRYRP